MTEEIYVCSNCDWEGKFSKLNPDLDGPITICPDCGRKVSIEEV